MAITFGSESLTYGDIDNRVSKLANALRERGVEFGDRVALLGTNHPAYLETLFAAGLLGAIFVPLNARLATPELTYVLRNCGARTLIYSADLADTARPAANEAGVTDLIALAGSSDAGIPEYDALIAAASPDRIDVHVPWDHPCYIMYTSGTTGNPKGAVLTHGNVMFAVMNAVIDMDIRSDEVSLVVAPMFHSAALNMVALPAFLKGGRLVIEERFDPGRVLRLIDNERITFGFGVPTMLDQMRAHELWESASLESLRCWGVGAAPVTQQTLETFLARGITLSQGYGLTETGPGALVLAPQHAASKVGSAGTPHFFTSVRIVDPDGVEVPAHERGEIQIHGPNVIHQYWDLPQATSDAFTEDGWFRSGDIGTADEDGYITIVDRLKDMIISGGENIYPAEIEAAIRTIPGIIDCAVFGVPHEKWGEVGCAAVSLSEGYELSEDRIIAQLRSHLASYKVPKSVVLVEAIPRNATGKIRKDILRREFSRHPNQKTENPAHDMQP